MGNYESMLMKWKINREKEERETMKNIWWNQDET